jgi:hypothetical protein
LGGRRGSQQAGARHPLPAHRKLANHLEAAKSWDAEFGADLYDLVGLVENVASA